MLFPRLKDFYLAGMFFRLFIIADADSQNPSCVFWLFAKLAFEAKGIFFLFHLPDRIFGSTVNLSFKNEGIRIFSFGIENKIYIVLCFKLHGGCGILADIRSNLPPCEQQRQIIP